MIGWKEFELSELTTKIGSGSTPRGGQESYKLEGVSLIRSQNILDFSFSYNGLAFIDDEQANGLKNVIVEKNDVLINITGDSVARTTKIPKIILPARVNQHVAILRADIETLDSNFLLYYLLNPIFKKYLLRIASDGATRNALTKSNLEDLIIKAPEDVSEQKAIAKILTAFDDKIELLQAQNNTLETTAQTIFKEWFGKYQIGDELPEGWRIGKLGEIVDIFDSKRIPLSKGQREERKGNYRYFGATSVMDYVDDYLFDGVYLLFAEDGSVIDDNGNPFLQYVWGKFWVNNHTHILRGKNGFSTELLYVFCKKMRVSGIVNGAVQLKINQRNLLNFELVIPSNNVLEKVELAIQPLLSKLRINSTQIQTLKKTRDTLLPKLMSGQLRVKI